MCAGVLFVFADSSLLLLSSSLLLLLLLLQLSLKWRVVLNKILQLWTVKVMHATVIWKQVHRVDAMTFFFFGQGKKVGRKR